MISLAARIKNFIQRSRWLGDILGSPYRAALLWLRIRLWPKTEATGQYDNYPFTFRGIDMPIVREIIHEKEYHFLKDEMGTIKSPLILDVGAHIGLFALCMLNFNPAAHILSIEASPETFRLLLANVRQAGTDAWHPLHRAAWSGNEIIKFDDSGISMAQNVSPDGKVAVAGITLAQLIEQTGQKAADLMKIDIEGAEEAFLCSQPDALRAVDRLVIELHKEFCNTDKVLALLKSTYGEVRYLTDRNSSRPVLYCFRLKENQNPSQN